jgi:hypothetical protein
MKKIMMMLVMATVALTASAQNTLRDNGTITLQPKVGVGIGVLSGEWTTAPGVDNKTRTGFVAGVEGEYYVNDWLGIAAGLNYAQQGWKFEGGGESATTKLDYLNIPVTADFYVAKGLALKTGVQFGFLMSAKAGSEDVKDACEKLNFSIPLGISYEISDFVIDFRYNMGLNKTNKPNNGNKARSDLLQITLGYKFAL